MKGNNETQHKIIYIQYFYMNNKQEDISSLLCIHFQILHYKSKVDLVVL